jgi:MATE family multidrug resistance protein
MPPNSSPSEASSDEAGESGSKIRDWWTRQCGGREVLQVALPLMISMMSWTIMNFVDRIFLLWHSMPAMAAAMPGGMVYFTLICFPLGITMYGNTFVAQYYGAGRYERIGAAVGQSIRVAVYSIVPILLVGPFADDLFRMANHSEAVAAYETLYLSVLLFGSGGFLISAAQSTFFTGRGETRVVMVVDSSAAILNVVLDYVMIFGHAGCPELGIEGAAWATVISQWAKVFFYAAVMYRPRYLKTYALLAGLRFDPDLFKRLLRFGGSSGLQFVVEIMAITLFMMLVGRLGEQAMVSSTIAFNVNSMAFVPILGLGTAVSTLVGKQLGDNQPELANRVTWTSYVLGVLYTLPMGLLYLFAPRVFLLGHAAGLAPDEFAELERTVVVLLRFVAFYVLFDVTAIVFVSAIKGAGDTRFVLLTTAWTAPLPLIIGTIGLQWFHLELLWCWTVITGWICLLGLIYVWRFMGGKWKSMRVIESDPNKPDANNPEARESDPRKSEFGELNSGGISAYDGIPSGGLGGSAD